MHKNSVIVEPPLHFALINRNMTAATNQKAARVTTDNIHVKIIDRDESDPALLLQELCALCTDRIHSASTQYPVVDGQGEERGSRGMRGRRRARVRVCEGQPAASFPGHCLPPPLRPRRRIRRGRAPLLAAQS